MAIRKIILVKRWNKENKEKLKGEYIYNINNKNKDINKNEIIRKIK